MSLKRLGTGTALRVAIALVVSIFTTAHVRSAPITWDGSDSTAWATGGNWVGNAAPANDTTTDTANFNGSFTNSPNAGTRSIAGITIGASNPAMTLSGTQLTIGSGGISINSAALKLTLASPTTLAANQEWRTDAALNTSMDVSGIVTLNGNTLTVNTNSAIAAKNVRRITITGALNDGSGAAGLIKTGAGLLYLNGAKTFTGGLDIQNGEVSLNGSLSSVVTISASGAGLTIDDGGSSSQIAGLVGVAGSELGNSNNAPRTFTINTANATSFSFAGTIQNGAPVSSGGGGALSIAKSGLGTQVFSGTTSSYTGATTLTNGILEIKKLANFNTVSSIGTGGTTYTPFTLLLNSGTLQYTGNTGDSTNRGLAFVATGNGGAIDSSGTLPISFTSTGEVSPEATKSIDTTSGSSTVTVIGGGDTTGLFVGMPVSGTGIPSNATVSSITNLTTFVLSQNASSTNFGVTGTFGHVTANDRTLTLKGSNMGNNIFAGLLQDSSGGGKVLLAKDGAGKWIVSGNNTYTGATTVTNGTLLINGNQSSAIGAVAVNGGTLGGTGTIGGAVSVNANGTLAPGASIGTLTINNLLTLSGTSIFEISKVGVILTNDEAVGITTLTYGGLLQIALDTGSDPIASFVGGDSWDLFDFTISSSGMFANDAVFGTAGDGVNLPMLTAGQTWEFDYDTGVLSIAVASGGEVPEPGSLAMWAILSAVVSVMGFRRFRRA